MILASRRARARGKRAARVSTTRGTGSMARIVRPEGRSGECVDGDHPDGRGGEGTREAVGVHRAVQPVVAHDTTDRVGDHALPHPERVGQRGGHLGVVVRGGHDVGEQGRTAVLARAPAEPLSDRVEVGERRRGRELVRVEVDHRPGGLRVGDPQQVLDAVEVIEDQRLVDPGLGPDGPSRQPTGAGGGGQPDRGIHELLPRLGHSSRDRTERRVEVARAQAARVGHGLDGGAHHREPHEPSEPGPGQGRQLQRPGEGRDPAVVGPRPGPPHPGEPDRRLLRGPELQARRAAAPRWPAPVLRHRPQVCETQSVDGARTTGVHLGTQPRARLPVRRVVAGSVERAGAARGGRRQPSRRPRRRRPLRPASQTPPRQPGARAARRGRPASGCAGTRRARS